MGSKKELYILRHGKSSWDLETISDRDRPLKLRGIRDSYEMARRLKIERHVPQLFISSPANRALHTASICLNVFELPYKNLKIDERLYGQGEKAIMEVIAEQDNAINRIMVFGHNPDFSELARSYTKNNIYDLSTCGLAVFTFNCQKWSEISADNKISEVFDYPKKEH